MTSKFIVFEGIDGAGKTTQIKLLLEELSKRGIKCFTTAEPTEYPSGKKIREALSGRLEVTPLEMAEMFAADRVIHNNHEGDGIGEVLSRGVTVISDRYYYSSLAYQGTVLGFETVAKLNLENPEIRMPDICIFLDLTPEQSLERITKGRDKLEIFENVETLTRVRERFFSVITDLEEDNIAIIDAYRTPEEIAEDIWTLYKSI